jgi:hypothetical protein
MKGRGISQSDWSPFFVKLLPEFFINFMLVFSPALIEVVCQFPEETPPFFGIFSLIPLPPVKADLCVPTRCEFLVKKCFQFL